MNFFRVLIFNITLAAVLIASPTVLFAQAATVTTQAATDVTSESAIGNGTIVNMGWINPYQHGMCWNTTGTPTIADSKTQEGSVSRLGAFTSEMVNLLPDTTYYVRAYATTYFYGTSYGNQVSFSTEPMPPVVTTQSVTDIGSKDAMGHGTIGLLGVPPPTQHGVCWGQKEMPTTDDKKTEEGAALVAGPFVSKITGLKANKTYYVRAYATNTAGTSYGNQVSFISNASIPVVNTQAVTEIHVETAIGHGVIVEPGDPPAFQHGTCWNTTGGPTTADAKTEQGAVTAGGDFISAMTGLTPGTVYFVRGYATNDAGTAYGEEFSFQTLQTPAVATRPITGIGTDTATGSGSIISLGVPKPTQHGLCWNISGAPTIADSKTELGSLESYAGALPYVFTSELGALTPGTVYYVRAYATNELVTVYGGEQTFTTLKDPVVTTQAVTDIGATTATGNGTIADLGVPNPEQHGVCWSIEPAPAIDDPTDGKTEEGSAEAIGPFVSFMTGLLPDTTYYVRAYAVNAVTGAVVYGGEEVSFTTLPQAAVVTTQAVTDIGTVTATGNGTLVDLGIPGATQHGFCWNTLGLPTVDDAKSEAGVPAGTGPFTGALTELSAGLTYYVRAYATNTAGTAYGEEVSFLTSQTVPVVTTQAVTDIGATTATGNGTIADLGAPDPTRHGVCWSTVTDPTIDDVSDGFADMGPATTAGPFSAPMSGLLPNTAYFVRSFAVNTAGTVYGDQESFTTLPMTATLTTEPVTDLEMTSATGNGTITDLGAPDPTQYGFCWNTGGTPTLTDSKTELGPASATGAFTSSLTDLTPSTTYYVRAYAVNAAGTSYGNEVSFFTNPLATAVTTEEVSDVGPTAATGHGTVVNVGIPAATQHGVCWNTGGSPTLEDDRTEEGEVLAGGPFTSAMTGLLPNTTYYVRAYATSLVGTVYGNQVSFSTLGVAPTLATQAVSEISTNTATGNGSISDLGIPGPTQHGLCWNTGGLPTIDDNRTEAGPVSVTGPFSGEMTGLLPGVLYYVRAYATNSAGTVYGNEVSFTTLAETSAPVAAILNAPPKITGSTAYQIRIGGLGGRCLQEQTGWRHLGACASRGRAADFRPPTGGSPYAPGHRSRQPGRLADYR